VTIPFDNIRTRMNTQCDIVRNKGICEGGNISGLNSNLAETIGNKQLKREFSFGSSYNVKGAQVDCICSSDEGKRKIKYRNTINTAINIAQSEGIRGFFKGLTPKTVTQSLSTAISWTSYEIIKGFLIDNEHNRK